MQELELGAWSLERGAWSVELERGSGQAAGCRGWLAGWRAVGWYRCCCCGCCGGVCCKTPVPVCSCRVARSRLRRPRPGTRTKATRVHQSPPKRRSPPASEMQPALTGQPATCMFPNTSRTTCPHVLHQPVRASPSLGLPRSLLSVRLSYASTPLQPVRPHFCDVSLRLESTNTRGPLDGIVSAWSGQASDVMLPPSAQEHAFLKKDMHRLGSPGQFASFLLAALCTPQTPHPSHPSHRPPVHSAKADTNLVRHARTLQERARVDALLRARDLQTDCPQAAELLLSHGLRTQQHATEFLKPPALPITACNLLASLPTTMKSQQNLSLQALDFCSCSDLSLWLSCIGCHHIHLLCSA